MVDNAIREAYNPNILYEPEKIFFWGMTRVRQHLHIRNKETLVMQEIYLRKMLWRTVMDKKTNGGN